MKQIILSILVSALSLCAMAQSSYCTNDYRFTEIPVFTDAQIASDTGVAYGQALNYQGQQQRLILNIFYPNSIADTFTKRPLILLVHGGSFLTGNLKSLNDDCIEFAKRGFVAATIEYRLGWAAATNCNGNTTSANLAVYRAIQDAHASLRYLVANAATYRIDTAWIFAGGNSAGSFATVNLAFVNQQEFNQKAPICQQTLGDIDTSGNGLRNTFTIKGLFHNWGSIVDIDFLKAEDAIPIVSFAGDQDIISHIDSGHYQNCPNYPFMWGSRAIYNKLVSFGTCAELSVKAGGGHGVYKDGVAQNLFRTERAVCFFKGLFCISCATMYTTDSIAANCTSLAPTGINETAADHLSIYPNPAQSSFTVKCTDPNGSLTIINALGETIYTSGISTGEKVIDCSAFAKGIYVLQLKTEHVDRSDKIVIQ